MARYPEIPDHPDIARTLLTGYPHESKSVKCADCEQEFYGDERIYICDGDAVCADCLKERLLDTHSIADLAEAFDIQGTTVEAFFAEKEDT